MRAAVFAAALDVAVTVAVPVPALAAGAAGGSPISIKTMDIHLEPEYDTTDVLVAYDLSFTNAAAADYGGKMIFHVPKGVNPAGPTNEVHICETQGSNKHAYCAPYTTETGNDYLTFTWSPSKALKPGADYPIYIEYYYNPLRLTGDRRDLDFYFHPSYDVGTLDLTVLAPLRSTSVTLDPQPKQQGLDSAGFSYVNYRYSNLKPEEPVRLKLSYAKPDTRPSIARAGASLSTGGAQSKGLFKDPSFYVLAVLVVGALGGLLVYGARGGSSRRRPRRGPSGSPSGASRPAAPRSEAQRSTGSSAAEGEKQAARRLLLSGKISEQTYREIVAEIDREKR